MINLSFDNTYSKLGNEFSLPTLPTPVKQPSLIQYNASLANDLGLTSALDSSDATAFFAGNLIPDTMQPIAMAYAGHQFGGFSPRLGDGRAVLLGEVVAPSGERFDLQLKGSGVTPFSRSGDGRSALGPVLREYLISETMAKYGVATTRALAAVATGEEVHRSQLLPGAILTRVASSFVRIGTFQYFAGQRNTAAVETLANYVIDRHYPEVRQHENAFVGLLSAVIKCQAKLIAQWMSLGFIHGVMNTDNMSIVGETIDYGPCAFMDSFSQSQVYSSIDRQGRYAYSEQPGIGLWNLTRLAETLLSLLSTEGSEKAVAVAQHELMKFQPMYERYWLDLMGQKLGFSQQQAEDRELVEDLLQLMEQDSVDFTLCFYTLSQLADEPEDQFSDFYALFSDTAGLQAWLQRWRERLASEGSQVADRQTQMQAVNPVYIPRNHQMEKAIRAAEDHNDFSVFYDFLAVLETPYVRQKGKEHYMQPPQDNEVVHQTFCGT